MRTTRIISLVAAAVATMSAAGLGAEEREYELRAGSVIIDGCRDCDRPIFEVPISGTFLLRVLNYGDVITQYEILDLDLRTAAGEYEVSGTGTYNTWLGEPGTQEMKLDLQVNGEAGIQLSSDIVETPVAWEPAWPAIDIAVSEGGDRDPFHVYTLHIVARPSEVTGSIPFRRAETNADGQVDISDVISLLGWLFTAGSEPGCLEAADANDDGSLDLSDAVYTLLYLFQGGLAPPAPGPDACGTVPEPHLGCAAYPSCAG